MEQDNFTYYSTLNVTNVWHLSPWYVCAKLKKAQNVCSPYSDVVLYVLCNDKSLLSNRLLPVPYKTTQQSKCMQNASVLSIRLRNYATWIAIITFKASYAIMIFVLNKDNVQITTFICTNQKASLMISWGYLILQCFSLIRVPQYLISFSKFYHELYLKFCYPNHDNPNSTLKRYQGYVYMSSSIWDMKKNVNGNKVLSHPDVHLSQARGHLNWRMGLPALLGGYLGCRIVLFPLILHRLCGLP